MLKIGRVECQLKDIFYLQVYLAVLLVIFLNLPKSVWIYYETRVAIVSLGILGMWRYAWWMLHVARSLIYGKIVFPQRRLKADNLWDSGWRPERVFVMMTTFKEVPSITQQALQSIVDECTHVGVPTKLVIGTGCDSDEVVIREYLSPLRIEIPFEVIMVRQKSPGKRFAIGGALRVLKQNGLEENDPIVFMDGDTILMPGCLQKCLPFFPLYPKMQALTTYEQTVILNGPIWLKKLLDMRYAQRDFTMQSYSLSNKVLTLTGRMSVFRGKHVLEPEFITIIENDHLTHWLWGRFRFLSGDDKSTWYYLLREKADMFYIPDALIITVENITGSPFDRMKENLLRWSGNTLRNGARAIALGPRRVGFFIWWCLIDQRITIWTMFIGHMITIILSMMKTGAFLMVGVLSIAFSRLCISTVLFYYARRLDVAYPLLLYVNQLMTSLIKIFIIFRLPRQKWKNRGDQKAGFDAAQGINIRAWVANYLTFFYCVTFLLGICLYLKMVSLPTLADLIVSFGL